MNSDEKLSIVFIARALGWIGLTVFMAMWVELAMIPILRLSPTGLVGRAIPIQIFVQFGLAAFLAGIAGALSRRGWFILSGLSLLSLSTFLAGFVSS
jgi:hypothetical protein